MKDTEIIKLFFLRDEKAIKETEIKYGGLCFQIAYNIIGDSDDAKECVNDAYLSLWNTVPPENPQNLRAFICKITRNLSLTKYKFNNRKKRSSHSTISLSDIENMLVSPPDEYSPEDMGKIIGDFLLKQSPDVRNVFLRRYWFGDSVEDISERFQFSKSKVKSILFNTRCKLKKYLTEEGFVCE